MSKQKGIYWLASYPKSGNTWFRVFLANLLNQSETPIDINQLDTGMIASAREWMEQALGFDSLHLTHDELDKLRPAAYEWFSGEIEGPGYHKVHDAYTYLDDKKPLIPTAGCLGALYFVRNPLDVAISFANHSNCSIDKAIENMGDTRFAFCKGKYRAYNQLRQWLLSWSMHVKSWTKAKGINVLLIRYEDMKLKPLETFTSAARFLQIEASQEDILRAISDSSIDKLQKMESDVGFCEKPPKIKNFFRKGIVGDWQNTLTPEQIKRIVMDHGEVMKTYGYLDSNGNPVLEYG